MRIELSDAWLGDLLDEAVRDAQALARSRSIKIRLEECVLDEPIRADALRLRQVLDNLLSNAIKYSPAETVVSVSTRWDDDWVEIDVADQGRGISEADRSVLFTLFGRVDTHDGRDTPGLGLGLAISERIVGAHGGSLTFAANGGGVGSVFSIRLPRGGPSADQETATIRVVGETSDG